MPVPRKLTRPRLLLLITVTITVVAAGAVYFLLPKEESSASSCVDPPNRSSLVPAEDADDNQLTVADTGFAPWELNDVEHLSYGFEIENRSEHVATYVSVSLRFLGADGELEWSQDNEDLVLADHAIPVILPGQTVGTGDLVGGDIDPDEVTEIEVKIERVEWVSAEHHDFAEIEVKDLDVEEYVEGNTLTDATYRVVSPYCNPPDHPGQTHLTRDAQGNIIGGMLIKPADSWAFGSQRQVTNLIAHPDIDETQTEVFVYPFDQRAAPST